MSRFMNASTKGLSDMLNALYNFNKSSQQLFLDLIHLRTGIELTLDDITIGTPMSEGHLATKVPVSAQPDGNLKGVVELTYDRLDLNKFFYGIPIKIETGQAVDETLISNEILNRWHVLIEPEDIEITTKDYGEGLPKRLTVSAKENSLAWVGAVDVWVLEPNHMSIIFGDFNITFNDNNVRRNAFIYSMEKILSEPSEGLINFAIGGKVLTTLTSATVAFLDELHSLSGDLWVLDPEPKPFNLKDAEIVYHGPLEASNTTFVIVFKLTPHCQNLFGTLILRYNP